MVQLNNNNNQRRNYGDIDQIDPHFITPIQLFDQPIQGPHRSNKGTASRSTQEDNEDERIMARPRLRSTSSKGSKGIPDPLSEQTIMENEIFQPTAITGASSQKSNTNQVEVEKMWSNLWGITQYGSQMLENKSSVARDHMANERTFLSWMRTSLGLTTAGVGVTQLFKIANQSDDHDFMSKLGKPIGGAFIGIAILCIIMGMMRFFKTQTLLQEDRYPAARLSVAVLVFLIFSVCITTLVAVLLS